MKSPSRLWGDEEFDGLGLRQSSAHYGNGHSVSGGGEGRKISPWTEGLFFCVSGTSRRVKLQRITGKPVAFG